MRHLAGFDVFRLRRNLSPEPIRDRDQSWGREAAQAVNCLFCKHEDLNLIPSSYPNRDSWVWGNPSAEVTDTGGALGLGGQPIVLSKFLAIERPCFRKKVDGANRTEQ